LLSLLVRRRAPSHEKRRHRAPAGPVEAGPRGVQWLVVAPGDGSHHRRAVRLAGALADQGVATTLVARRPGDANRAPGGEVRVLRGWNLAELRAAFSAGVDRRCVLIGVADAETMALARDLGRYGARILYDAPSPAVVPAPTLSYDAETERALVATVDDLIGGDLRTARHLSAQAGGGHLVHVLASPEDAGGWSGAARTLIDLTARPTAVVLLATGTDRAASVDAAAAFAAARSDGAYRLVVVAGAHDPAGDALDAMEEEGRLRVLRSARPGRLAAWNLGIAATRSELVALVHSSHRPDGIGCLAPALEVVAARREIGAVGLRPVRPPGVARDPDARLGEEGLRVAALDGLGLVAPRSVLRRAGGFDESPELGTFASVDLSFRIRDLGLGLALCPALGLRGGDVDEPGTRGAARELRRRWSDRPRYLAGDAGSE